MKKLFVYSIALLTATTLAQAAVTVDGYWRLGESDPGATNGGTFGATSVATVGSNLTVTGSPTYSNSTFGGITTLSASGNGSSSFSLASAATNLTDNFGIEGFFNANTTAQTSLIVNGTGAAEGFGIIIYNNKWSLLLGNVGVYEGTAVTTGSWFHLAAVRDSGTSTLYLDGVAIASTTATPNAPSSTFAIANTFNGLADEARVFHFTGGNFQTSDLLYSAAIPEPQTWFALAFASLILFSTRLRRVAKA